MAAPRMAPFNLNSLELVASFLLLGLALSIYHHSKQNLPPGPQKLPLTGNLHQIPKVREWVTFGKWAKEYGDIIYITALGQKIVVLSSAEDAYKLFHQRSKVYSGRPTFQMAGELMGWKATIGLAQYDITLRRMRRLVHQTLSSPLVLPTQRKGMHNFVRNLASTPERFVRHIRHAAGSVVLELAYGYTPRDNSEGDDRLILLVERAMHDLSLSMTPGAFFVDIIPWLTYVPTWFPGASFRRKAAEWGAHFQAMMDEPYDFACQQTVQDQVTHPSLVSLHLPNVKSADDQYVLKHAAGSLYAAGADTIASSLSTFFLMMALNPNVQRKAQSELDAVVGSDCLPQPDDRKVLPYINALSKEVLRILPPAPLGLPHLSANRDHYQGYNIPEGTTILSNIWAMTRDSKLYPDAEKFRPERYLSGELKDFPFSDPSQIIFGVGKRRCPGQSLAENSVFLAIAMTLAVFNIDSAVSLKTGEPISLEGGVHGTAGLVSMPEPFTCRITPRSTRALELIQ